MNNFKAQLQQYSVALISLAIALTSLGYNTWRNEQTEANRNVRAAGFELLLKLGELEQVVFFNHYDKDAQRGSPRAGWAYILTIKDLGVLSGELISQSCNGLVTNWQAHWQNLGKNDRAVEIILQSIDQTRALVLDGLNQLD